MPTNNAQHAQTLSIAIDAERIIGALIDADGTISAVNAFATPLTDGRDALLQAIATVGKQSMLAVTGDALSSIGVLVSAPVERDKGLVLQSDTLPQLNDVPLAGILQDELGYPVRVENDVNAMALLEAHSGAGVDADSIFYVFVDNDINGAIVQNKTIWHGKHSSAGEIAHLVVDWMGPKAITLGQRASGHGIAAEYSMRSRKHRKPDIDEIIQYARQGDHLAIRVIRDAAQILGSVLSPVMNLIDPELVIVGGRFAHIGDLWWANFVSTFNDATVSRVTTAPAVRAQYDEDAALRGAALIAQMA